MEIVYYFLQPLLTEQFDADTRGVEDGKRRLEEIIHHPTGLILVDTEMRIVYWNAEAERITGYSAEEAVGQHCSFLDGIPCGKRCGLFEVASEKPITCVTCSVLHRNGTRISLSKNVDLLRNAEGEVIGGIEAFVDIS